MNTKEGFPTAIETLEKETFFAEPTPVEQLIPGIDLTKFSTKEEIKKWQGQAYQNEFDNSDIGRGQSDAFFLHFLMSIPGTKMDDNFVVKKLENSEEALEPLRKRFGGKVLIDIGSGGNDYGYQFAQLVGARAYVAVDPFSGDFLRDSLKPTTEEEKAAEKKSQEEAEAEGYTRIGGLEERKPEQNTIPWNTVSEDALKFIQSLPEKSVSILMSGIRERVIPTERAAQIIQEIPRVLAENGALLAYESEIFPAWVPSELEVEKVLDRRGNERDNAMLYVRKAEESGLKS